MGNMSGGEQKDLEGASDTRYIFFFNFFFLISLKHFCRIKMWIIDKFCVRKFAWKITKKKKDAEARAAAEKTEGEDVENPTAATKD